jgi:hypothetical protein
MNRIKAAVKKMHDLIAAKNLSAEELAKVSKTCDITLEELGTFQVKKNLAMMQGRITLDEAQTLYEYLGEQPAHFNSQPLEVKIVLIKTMTELLKVG